jgi:glycosyltransferase involved in cell wall biosynthesis
MSGDLPAVKHTWHIITCEYPPQIGGVSDYTHLLAHQLHAAGDEVHVWAPSLVTHQYFEEPGIALHRSLGSFNRESLSSATKELTAVQSSPRELLLQWVPHGYGRRSMNIGFCRWIQSLVRSGYRLSLMVHEPFLEAKTGSWKQRIAARVHRRMIRILLHSASRVFISIPAWEIAMRPFAPASQKMEWLPIPATVPVAAERGNVKQRFGNQLVLGHLGTYSATVTSMLAPALLETLTEFRDCVALLIGNGSDRFAESFTIQHPALMNRVYSTGALHDAPLSQHLAACDLMLQPYPDGLTTRRTSLMNLFAHRLPVVSNFGHLSEDSWKDWQAVAISSPDHFARTCVRLLSTKTEREDIAVRGRELYLARFDWPRTVAALRSTPETRSANTIS